MAQTILPNTIGTCLAGRRDAVGNPVSIQREDGYTVYYEYDAKHQLTAEIHVDQGSEIYAWEWDYDAAGNREYEDFNGEATYYEYNAGNELVSETTGGETTYYEYDRCGNTTPGNFGRPEAAGHLRQKGRVWGSGCSCQGTV